MSTSTFEFETVSGIFQLLGATLKEDGRISLRLNGAMVYTGSRNFQISLESKSGNSGHHESGFDYIEMGCGISFRPNFGKKVIKFFVCYNYGTDTFDFWVFKTRGTSSKMLVEVKDIYLDMLAQVVESKYDELIKSECQGFISLD